VSVPLIDPKQLKRIRVRLGMTQAELARASNVSQSLIAKLESGHVDPSFATMKAVSETLRSHIQSEGRKASDIMSKPVLSIQSSSTLAECINLLRERGISQVPIYSGQKVLGSLSEARIVLLLSGAAQPKELLATPVSKLAEASFPIVDAETPVDALYSLFEFVPAVLVTSGEEIAGIVTKIDMISADVR